MQITILTDDPDIKAAVLAADPTSTLVDPSTGAALKSDLGARAAIALTVKSLSALPALAKKLYEALSGVMSKPKATITIEGPQGSFKLTLENMTEQSINQGLAQSFAFSERQAILKTALEKAGDGTPAKAPAARRQRK
ncbi:hypothetical protein [Rhizobium sp. BK068]|uniref:hypothetical protein n=1 Tax=Rhizobium sp. BK068 TaxID=2512130 RepID=UPI00104CBBC9|nr:hypothetical protein [Rhizobium sp. BK068]TCM76587.1 hypothetical protein EV291_1094 [Rhizobium sp. BK068]